MQRYHRLSTFAETYDAFILDLWGVVHDGQSLYPGVLQALKTLHKQNKKIVFLSNAPRRSWKAEAVLTALGIPREWYSAALTSGEMTYHYVLDYLTRHTSQTTCYYYIGPEKDADIFSGLLVTSTQDASAAAFAIATGFNTDDSTLDEKLPDIEKCLKARLTLLCANPDYVVVRQNGSQLLCAGIIAREYERRGGKVIYFGKPYLEIYQKCLSLLAAGNSQLAPIAIGDSLHTDIAGARNAGIFSVLVTGGILRKTFGLPHGTLPQQEAIDALCHQEHVWPHAVIPCLQW